MKTIKLTKKQIKILTHSLEEYQQFLECCDDEQIKEEHDKSPTLLFKSIENIFKKLTYS